MHFSEQANDIIFADFIHSTGTDADLSLIEAEIQRLREDTQSPQRSERGGYHSMTYGVKGNAPQSPSEVLEEVIDGIRWYANKYIGSTYNFEPGIEVDNWWFMINSKGNYNVPHTHGNADIAAVFYVKTPESCGDIVWQRTDGAQYARLPQQKMVSITPMAGRLYLFPAHLLHWVEPSQSDTERICIACNLVVKG